MRNLLSWMLAIITAMVVFISVTILIPIQTQDVENMRLSYIFVDEKGKEYDIFEPIHGAATDWSFLFEENGDESNSNYNDGNNTADNLEYIEIENKVENIEEIESNDLEDNNQGSKNDDKLDKDEKKETEQTESINNEKNDQNLKEPEIAEIYGFKQCTTPWGTILSHGESVIAYQQRSDVPEICNAQKRSCNNGILNGSYTQGACKEDIEYKYKKIPVVSYNTKILGELIQTPKYAKNDGAEFDTKGKINSEKVDPISQRDNNIKNNTTSVGSVIIDNKQHYNCSSPWGEIIKHGQFIKAYKSPLGFTDDVCQVELRLCVDGNLNGRYLHKSCEYSNISSQDFKEGNADVNKPSKELLEEVQNNKKQGIWGWFIGLFR